MADYIDKQRTLNVIFEIAENVIKSLPSADVQSVRHGHWIKVGWFGRSYKCDQCGNFLDFDGVNVGRGDANYCPNCGARMSVVENENK